MAGSKRVAADAAEEIVVDDAEALAAKKAAKKAKKAAAAAAAAEAEAEPQAEEDAEAAALAAKKAAKKAKKAVAAAEAEKAAAVVEEPPAQDDEAAARAAKKAAKKAAKAAAAAAEVEEAPTPAPKKKKAEVADEETTETPAPKKKKEELESAQKETSAKAAEDTEEWKDNTYKCIDCNEDWVDTADDQAFRWNSGFAETPKRCKDCRWAKKVRMEGGDPAAKGKGKGKKGNKEFEIFVGGLPFSTTEEVLRKDFTECGEIANFRMPLNDEGNARGIAFIEYKDKESVEKALKFHETDYGGRTLSVRMSGEDKGKGKGKDGKDGKAKGKGKDGKDGKGKSKGKGKKGKASSEAFAKNTGAMVEATGTKAVFADSDDE